jgi:hypothetical protein
LWFWLFGQAMINRLLQLPTAAWQRITDWLTRPNIPTQAQAAANGFTSHQEIVVNGLWVGDSGDNHFKYTTWLSSSQETSRHLVNERFIPSRILFHLRLKCIKKSVRCTQVVQKKLRGLRAISIEFGTMSPLVHGSSSIDSESKCCRTSQNMVASKRLIQSEFCGGRHACKLVFVFPSFPQRFNH